VRRDCSIPDHERVPELPEVQSLAESLDRRLTGRRIARLSLASVSALKTYDPPVAAIDGRAVTGVGRRGKFLDLQMGAEPGGDPAALHLVIHLSRGGWIHWREVVAERRLAQRGPLAARLHLEDGAALDITEQGTEKRLAIHIVRDPAGVAGVSRLGVDALDARLDQERLGELLRGRPGTLKAALGDQAVIAGVGNAYSDEILHAAHLSPFARADRLDAETLGRLWSALKDTLGEALDRARALDLGELKDGKRLGMRVHGRTGQPCPDCGDTVRGVSLATRSFQYCPTCQTGGRVYADRRMSRLLR
jgi:formamidopyrimidine-DNA glycosylase